MNSMDRFAILEQIQYKPGWYLSSDYNVTYLRWTWKAKCVKTGSEVDVTGRKWILSEHMTESELVCTALKAALTCEEHETREHFTYEGKRVFNPHINVRRLLEICDDEDVRD